METMYDRIMSLCKARGVAPSTLFREIGLSPSRLSAMRRGDQKSMSQPNLEKLARALNTTSAYLVYGESSSVFLVDVDKEKVDLAPLLKALSQDNLFALMKAISDELKNRTEKEE